MSTSFNYFQTVSKLIQELFVPDDPTGSMTAAKAGAMLRQHVDPPQQAGYFKLKDLLQEFERQGLIRTGFNSKGAFAFWLANGAGTPQPAPVSSRPVTAGPIRRLRQQVWYAFVAGSSAGPRYLNRRTGAVRIASDELQPPNEWTLIAPVQLDTEIQDARRFLEAHSIDLNSDIETALESEKWFVELPGLLDRETAFKWKRHRTSRVVEHVEEWRRANNIDEQLVYEIPTSIRRTDQPQSGQSLRTVVLASLSRMSTEELLNLAIPARHLIAEIRPDLLSQ